MEKTHDRLLICENCYLRKNCGELPDKNGRCMLRLKDGDIQLDKDQKINPLDTVEFDYDDLKMV
jgi:hypothetical protein